jgi:integrase
VRGRIEAILDWATVRGHRSGDNPARWKGHLAEVLPRSADIAVANHHAALPYSQLPEFLAELRKREGVAARALEFCILTAARTNEVIGARWGEFDLKTGIWTVPAERMKGRREHRVPLSGRALEILRGLPEERGNDFVFIAPRGPRLSGMSMPAVMGRMGRQETVHGFRSTFSDWAHETTAYPAHVIEQSLAHSVGNKVEQAYRRGDLFAKRTKLMSDWAKYCTTAKPVKGAVIPLRKAATS